MATLHLKHTGRQLAGSCFVALSIVACSGTRFSNAADTSNSNTGNISPQNNSLDSGSPIEDTACGLARVDALSNAVDACLPQGQFVMGSPASEPASRRVRATHLPLALAAHSPRNLAPLTCYL